MFPKVYEYIAGNMQVQATLGASPRFSPAGDCDDPQPPYATWQVIGGVPSNSLGDAPDTDQYTIQIDVYATTLTASRDAAKALRDALEPHGYVVAYRGETKDPTTKLKKVSFDMSIHEYR